MRGWERIFIFFTVKISILVILALACSCLLFLAVEYPTTLHCLPWKAMYEPFLTEPHAIGHESDAPSWSFQIFLLLNSF